MINFLLRLYGVFHFLELKSIIFYLTLQMLKYNKTGSYVYSYLFYG